MVQDFHLDPTVDNYCVMGNPVAHSLSPQIQTLFAEQTGQKMYYQAIFVELNGFAEAVEEFRRQGGKGMNITLPFKEDAWRASDTRSERAERAHAVNTIRIEEDGSISGHNTDGAGLVRDLTVNHGCKLTGSDILVLGAGGAASGIIDPVMDESPARLVIANRTVSRAEDLAKRFSDRGNITACGFDDLAGQTFPLIINATAASLQGEIPPIPDDLVAKGGCCYDMMYSREDTAFIAWAKSRNAGKALDGIGMLVEQAAESFLIWRGIRPDTSPIIEIFKNKIDV